MLAKITNVEMPYYSCHYDAVPGFLANLSVVNGTMIGPGFGHLQPHFTLSRINDPAVNTIITKLK